MSSAKVNQGGATGGSQPMSAGDLAELMKAFNEVTLRLEATHETLRAEV